MQKLTDESLMPIGKFKGEKMANVPAYHLIWLNDQSWCRGALKAYIINNLDALNAENAINNKKSFDYKHYFSKR